MFPLGVQHIFDDWAGRPRVPIAVRRKGYVSIYGGARSRQRDVTSQNSSLVEMPSPDHPDSGSDLEQSIANLTAEIAELERQQLENRQVSPNYGMQLELEVLTATESRIAY